MPSRSSRRPLRLAALPVLFLTALGLLLGGLSVPAFAAPVTVSGSVTGADNAALAGVTVKLGTLTGTTFTPVTTAPATITTAAGGTWTGQVDNATTPLYVQYTVGSYDTAYYKTGGSATTDPTAASSVDVTAGATGLAAQLTKGSAQVTGTVVRKGSLASDKLSGVTVTLKKGTSTVGTATTAGNGTYKIDDVVPDSYTLLFSGAGLTTSYFTSATDSTTTAANAAAFSLSNGQSRTDGNGFVPSSTRSEIGGTVTTSGGSPISGATITLFTRSAADAQTGQVSYTSVATQNTGADGTWKLDQTFGKYVVELKAPAYGTYYFQGNNSLVTNRDSAPEIEVKEGVANRLNASLSAASTTTITGKVTSGTTPVQGVTISVEYSSLNAQGQTTWTEVQSTKATTAADGTYTANVPPVSGDRTYVVGFSAPGYRAQFYNAKATRETATPLAPTFASPSTGVNASLTAIAQVTGRVTDSSGAGLSGVTVSAITYTPGTPSTTYGSWSTLQSGGSDVAVATASDGTYQLEVPTDTKFRLQFSGTGGRATRYYPNANFPDEAGTLSVPSSTVLSGRNMTLPTRSLINGLVNEVSGAAYTGSGQITAWSKVSWSEAGEQGGASHTSWFPVADTSAAVSGGAFQLRAPAGTYRLKFVDAATTEEGFLPGLVGLDQAPDVTLGTEQTLSNQAFTLPAEQAIRGRIYDAAGTGIAGAVVGATYSYVDNVTDGVNHTSSVIGPNASPARRQTTTQNDGTYVLVVRSRTYRVFGKATPAADPVYFGDVAADGTRTARDVVVNNADVSNIDIQIDTVGLQNLVAPWITGLNDEGGTLTAANGQWAPTAGLTYSYAWEYRLAPTTSAPSPAWTALTRTGTTRSDGLGNPSADGKSVALPTSSLLCQLTASCAQNAQYRVTVTGTRPGATVSVTTLPTALMADTNPAQELRAAPRVLGQPIVGQTVSADPGVWASQTTYTYQWYAGLAEIPGATSSTYTPAPADLGKTLQVDVVPSGTNAKASSAASVKVVAGSLTNTKAPSITGTPQVGMTLTAAPGTWSKADPQFRYQWLANGQAISGATDTTYTPVEGDVAKSLTVQVTASSTGYTPGVASSAPTALVSLDGSDPTILANKTAPTITGTPQVGQVLTADDGTWTNKPTSFTYQWSAGTAEITGATAKTFTPTAAEVGKQIKVTVTARKSGYEPVAATSDPTTAVAKGVLTNTVKPSISGSVAPGSTVTALPGTWTPASGVSFAYQWLLDGVAVADATTASYAVMAADLGKKLSVRVTGSATGYNDLSVVSPAIVVTESGNSAVMVTKAATIDDTTPVVGQTLKLTPGTTDPTGTTVKVQWLRDGSAITGAIGTTYKVTDADLGKPLAAMVTYSKDGYTDATETVSTSAVQPATPPTEPVKPKLATVKKLKGDKLVIKVTVTAKTQDPVTGQVKLTEGGALKSLKTLNGKGKKKLVVKNLRAGYHTFKLTFLGNDLVKKKSKTISVTVRG